MLLFGRSVVSDSATPSTAAHQASLSFTISWSVLKLMSIDLLMPFNSTVSSSVAPFSSCLQSFSASGSFPVNQLFTSGGQSNEHPGLISFGMDWLDLLAVQGTLKSSLTPQFKSINSSVLSFLCSPTLTSIHGQWKNHSLA